MREILRRTGTLCLLLMLTLISKAQTGDVTALWDFQNVNPATLKGMAIEGTTGTIPSTVEGIELFVDASKGKLKQRDSDAQFNENTIIRVPVKASGDEVTVVSYPNYHKYTIAGIAAEADETIYKATGSNASDGYVEIVATASAYLYSIKVLQKAPKQLATLDNEPATATFDFNLGTEGQKADFGEAAIYFVTSKVTYGSNLVLHSAKTTGDSDQTLFMPLTQQNEGESGTAADESNAIRFLIQPNHGLSFTPKKVSLRTTRYGTDNGLIDVSWENPDKSTVNLATAIKPERNNSTPNVSDLSYTIEGATPGEGTCGLLINLYHLQNGKQIGFGDIVIEGTLNGTEKEVPVLATVTIAGEDYTVEALFDDAYETTFELTKTKPMVSESNPITATAKKGEVGTITYQGDDTQCVVTIPMSFGETSLEYTLNVIQKPDFKLTYIDTDKMTVLCEAIREKDQAIGEFDFDYNEANVADGDKVRGWFFKTAGGEKITNDYVITGDLTLYAVATEIEVPSTFKKYTFDLTDKLFDPADHEAFNPSGNYYWHDAQHGWAFKADENNKIDLLVGPKATISLTLCRYGSANDIVITDAYGNEIGTLPGKNNEEVDGEIVAFNYEGEGGTITLNLSTEGEMYLHAVKIVNTSETNYDHQGNWYFVKPNSAESFIEVLEIVNGINASKDAERSIIFLPAGVYDLNETVKTAISGHNISIIGEKMEDVVIATAPDKSLEGLGSADMLQSSGTNLYLQDLTLVNNLDYYGALGNGQVGGRAAVLQDSGNRTIGKNIEMMSYQDTYYSSNDKMQSYWEDCNIHGTVDFICGGGDVRFQNTTITLEARNLDGTGGRTVVAPRGKVNFGYVFDNCNVVDLAVGKGNWNLGRTWNNQPITVYLNTTLDDNAAKTLVSSRWTQKGMNNTDPVVFGEFNTMDANGNNITPESNIITSYGGEFQTILNAEQAAGYSYEKMFSENAEQAWDPAALTKQLDAPANLNYDGNKLVWDANDEAQCWAIFKEGKFMGITTTPSYEIDNTGAEYSIRAANKMGGLGKAAVYSPEFCIISFSEAGYATYYNSKKAIELPSDVQAYVVTKATTNSLTYEEIKGYVPSGTAVMLKSLNNRGKKIYFDIEEKDQPYEGENLLHGSDSDGETTPYDPNCLTYKLAFGHSNTASAKVFGWYWGAEDGKPFMIEGHHAWLVVNKESASTRGYPFDMSDLTGINTLKANSQETGTYYNLQGQRVTSPNKGMYILNNKKVFIK